MTTQCFSSFDICTFILLHCLLDCGVKIVCTWWHSVAHPCFSHSDDDINIPMSDRNVQSTTINNHQETSAVKNCNKNGSWRLPEFMTLNLKTIARSYWTDFSANNIDFISLYALGWQGKILKTYRLYIYNRNRNRTLTTTCASLFQKSISFRTLKCTSTTYCLIIKKKKKKNCILFRNLHAYDIHLDSCKCVCLLNL